MPLAALLVLWGTTLLTGVATADGPGEAAATDLVLQAGSHPGERILIRIEDTASDDVVFELSHQPVPDSERTLRIPIGPGLYRVTLHASPLTVGDLDAPDPKPNRYRVDLTECMSRARLTVHFDHAHETVHYHQTGCLDIPTRVTDIAREAQRGTPLPTETRPPADASRTPAVGVWLATDRIDAANDDAGHEAAWGDEIVWFGRTHASPLLGVAALPPDGDWMRTLQTRSDRHGEPRGEWTEGIVMFDATTGTTHGASRNDLALGWTATLMPIWHETTAIRYDERAPFPECLVVSAADAHQAATLEQLARCLRVPANATWYPAPATDDGGALGYVAVWPRPAGDGIATVTYDGGGLLPSVVRVYDRTPSGIVTHRAAWLSAAHEPAPPHQLASPARWARADLVPLDPMTGPRGGSGANGPFAFPLESAVAAARSDPVLGARLALVEQRGGVLAGAVYQYDHTLSRLGGLTGTDFTQPTWALLFTTETGPPVPIVCRHAPKPTDTTPGTHCRPDDDGVVRRHLGAAPAMGRDALPERGASWESTGNAWRGPDPARADAQARLGLYRAWHDEEHDRRALIAVGDDLRYLHTPSAATSTQGSPREVHLDLETGAPLIYRTSRIETRDAPDLPSLTAVGHEPAAPAPAGAPASAPAQDVGVATMVAGTTLLAFGYLWHILRRARDAGLMPLVPLWARRDQPGDRHPIRVAILEMVTEQPGIIRARIKSRLRVRNGQLDHHLDVLLARGEIFEVRERGARCFFRTGAVDNDQAARLAALSNPKLRAARDLVHAEPGLTVTALAQNLQVSKGHASRLVRRLVESGHAEVRRDGNRVLAYPPQGHP